MNQARDDWKVGGLEVLTTGLNLAELDLHGGEGLWPEVRRYTDESQLEALVDRCMGGRSAPRLWAFLESPGAGPSAAAAALGTATLLADRGQAVVLLDVDEQDPRITRWLGRTEQEGWIDMVRFGASLHAASDPLPSDNRRGSVVGVGSFSPTGVTPEEVVDLLGRLRHQADDLVIVVPAKLRSQPWLEQADIRLLCWDLLSRSGRDTETILTELDRMSVRPDAVLGFGAEEYAAIQSRLQETRDVPDTEDGDEVDLEAASEAPARELLTAESPIEPLETEGAGSLPDLEDGDEPEPRRTSRVFVWVAVAVTVCVIAAGLFVAGQWQGDQEEPTRVAEGAIQPDQRPVPVTTTPEEATIPEEATTPDETAAEDQPAAAMDAMATDEPPTAGQTAERLQPEGGGPVTPPVDAGATSTPERDLAATPSTDAPGESVATPETPADDDSEAAPVDGFDPTAFQGPVGEAGWTLWLSSLPTEADARREIRDLERRGLVAEYRAVELEDRGRWFRVYTGNFASRNAANAAAARLKAYLDTDWAVSARF